MAKLTQKEIERHESAMEMLNESNVFHAAELSFFYENYHEGATNINSLNHAHFTPYGLAKDMVIEYMGATKILDACAGTGVLSAPMADHWEPRDITAVELNTEYYTIGKKLLPRVNWINSDIFDAVEQFKKDGVLFDLVISNPPFNIVKKLDKSDKHIRGDGNESPTLGTWGPTAYRIIDAVAQVAKKGVFLLPTTLAGFEYSKHRTLKPVDSGKVKTFEKQTGLKLEHGIGVMTNDPCYVWKGVKPEVEIVCIDFQTDERKRIMGGLFLNA